MTDKPRARMQIVNWRRCGDDESYNTIGIYAADDPTTVHDEISAELDAEYADTPNNRPEVFINDDLTYHDGELLKHGGREFRLRLEEVTA